MGRLTPQDKKRHSYAKDRRNCYGESPHGARKSIPRNKALRNRANRHRQDQALAGLGLWAGEGLADEAESRMWHRAPKRWVKYPDAPLSEVLKCKKEYREWVEARGGRRALLKREASS